MKSVVFILVTKLDVCCFWECLCFLSDHGCCILYQGIVITYQKAVIVFDGCNESPTIKDESQRRWNTHAIRDFNFSPSMKFVDKKEQLNWWKEQASCNCPHWWLAEEECTVNFADRYADVNIVCAVTSFLKHFHTTVIAENTELITDSASLPCKE